MDINEAMRFWTEWYSQNAEVWEARFARRCEPLYQELVQRAQITHGSTVLDVGTGTGGAGLQALQIMRPGGSVVAIDNAEGMLRVARVKAERLASSFPPGAGLREAYRVLRSGGKLTFSMFGKHLGASSLLNQIYGTIFERYQTSQPSELLRRAREASSVTYLGIMRYGPPSEPSDPSAVLGFMRNVGFRNVEVAIIQRA